MDSSHTNNTTFLTNLLVFNNTLQPGHITKHLLTQILLYLLFSSHVWFFNERNDFSLWGGGISLLICLFSLWGVWVAELMRSLHVYRQGDGEERIVEREFVFSDCGSYGEMQATPILRLVKSHVSAVCEGYKNGVWLCTLAFHADHTPQFCRIPPLLLVSRYIFLARIFVFDISQKKV